MIVQTAAQIHFDFFGSASIVLCPVEEHMTSDTGLLLFRQFDERIGFTEAFVDALEDPRQQPYVEHSFTEMVRSRVYGILAGYADQNDHDLLRNDPVFKLVCDQSPNDAALASQPTLSRFENQIDIPSLRRLRDVLLDQFIASFATPPGRITLDLDAVDDPAHGEQQLVLFHAHYDQHQYYPLVISCAENDLIVAISLRMGTASAALGADDDLRYVVDRLRAVWPDVDIHVRGDSGYGCPIMYAICETLGVTYTFGLAPNSKLNTLAKPLLDQAVQAFAETKEQQRLFDGLWYRAKDWPIERFVVVKAEAGPLGTNCRFAVTNRPGAPLFPDATYDEYVQRGESENRHKELKCGLEGDRLSDHRFIANFFRLYLHTAALNLLVLFRREIADPSLADPHAAIPTEALTGAERRAYHNRRRQMDPLGEGHPATWRQMIIKVASRITVSTRRVVVKICSSWPYLDLFQRLCRYVTQRPTTAVAPVAPSG